MQKKQKQGPTGSSCAPDPDLGVLASKAWSCPIHVTPVFWCSAQAKQRTNRTNGSERVPGTFWCTRAMRVPCVFRLYQKCISIDDSILFLEPLFCWKVTLMKVVHPSPNPESDWKSLVHSELPDYRPARSWTERPIRAGTTQLVWS